ncbi:MAG: hypothetical protein HY788_05915 [Deltaproteobacteria bacterium]|nr:hypothetical protein [Deltaproteobacteria bacterium]
MSTKRDAHSDASIDIKQELADLFEKEDVVAYFDVTSSPGITPPLTGICKVAKPLAGSPGQQYVSLLFILDTPDADTLRIARECVKQIDERRLIQYVPEITSAVPMPESMIGDAYVRHIDVLLAGSPGDQIQRIVGEIYEALRDIPSLELGELVWWEGEPSDSMNEGRDAPRNTAENVSLMDRIKKRLGITLK